MLSNIYEALYISDSDIINHVSKCQQLENHAKQ